MKLAKPGLNVPLQKAQQVYGEIGERLYRGAGLRKQERRNLVAARRLLEEAWGISLLREGVRQPSPKSFTAKMPLHTLDSKDATQATVVFGRVPEGHGANRRFREQVQAILYGVAEQEEADALALKRLKSELVEVWSFIRKASDPKVKKPAGSLSRRTKRLSAAISKKDSIEGKLKEMQDRRQRQANLLGEALEEFGISPLGKAETRKSSPKPKDEG